MKLNQQGDWEYLRDPLEYQKPKRDVADHKAFKFDFGKVYDVPKIPPKKRPWKEYRWHRQDSVTSDYAERHMSKVKSG